MGDTSIEWTDKTWNPIRGCSRVSKGCERCYAERQAIRQIKTGYAGLIKRTSHGPAWTGEVRLVPELLDAPPIRWRKPRRIFVNSMSDLFHENALDDWIDKIFAVMALCPQHTFQVLTKRPQRMLDYFTQPRERVLQLEPASASTLWHVWSACTGLPGSPPWSWCPASVDPRHHPYHPSASDGRILGPWPLPNVQLGVSVENQETADERIPLLLKTPAAVRFVSYEPALGPVNFNKHWCLEPKRKDGEITLVPTLHWLIVGGESGPGARPCDIAWIRSAVEQCKAAGVPVFVKQLGDQPYEIHRLEGHLDGAFYPALKNRKGGDPAEWPNDLRVREFPA